MVLLEIIIIAVSLYVLLKSSDYLLTYAARIARNLNVSEFLIGLTLVAIGTSFPELSTSIIAALENNTGIIIGNIVGSNIANISLILGLACMLTIVTVRKEFFFRDGIFLMAITLLFYLLSLDHVISWTEGLVYILGFISYIYILYLTKPKEEEKFVKFLGHFYKLSELQTIKTYEQALDRGISYKEYKRFLNHSIKTKTDKSGMLTLLLKFIISLVFLLFSAKFIVDNAVSLSIELGVRQEFIGLTLIAIGTSLPELAVTISSIRKHMSDILLGNIIGSNIANILLVIGVSSLISPIYLTTHILLFSMPVMLFTTLLLLGFISKNWLMRGLQGIAFLFIYLIYIVLLIILEL